MEETAYPKTSRGREYFIYVTFNISMMERKESKDGFRERGKEMRLTGRYPRRQERSGVLHYLSTGTSGGWRVGCACQEAEGQQQPCGAWEVNLIQGHSSGPSSASYLLKNSSSYAYLEKKLQVWNSPKLIEFLLIARYYII